MSRIEELDAQIAQLQKERELLINVPSDVRTVAEELHRRFCRWNHTDGCGWLYEKDDWSSYAHQKWAGYARTFLDRVAEDLAPELVEHMPEVVKCLPENLG